MDRIEHQEELIKQLIYMVDTLRKAVDEGK